MDANTGPRGDSGADVGDRWWPRAPTTRAGRVGLAVAYAALLGVATLLADFFSTPLGVSVWFPPAALTVAYFSIDARLTSALVAAGARLGWALTLSQSSRPVWVLALVAVTVALAYLAVVRLATALLATREARHRPDVADLSLLVGCVAILGPAAAAITSRSTLALTGQVGWETVVPTATRFWIGDAVAILTIVPALWGAWWLARTSREPGRTPEQPGGTLTGPLVGIALVSLTSLGVLSISIGTTTPLYLLLLAPMGMSLAYGLGGSALAVGATGAVLTTSLALREAAWLDVSAAHLFLIVGSIVILTVGTVVDLRRRLIRELEASQRRARALVEEVQDYAMYTLDSEGRITWWNAGAERLTGYPVDEAVGQEVTLLDSELTEPGTRSDELLEQARSQGRATTQGWRVARDGRPFWADVVLTETRRGQDVVGFTNVTRDLTERREFEVELQRTAHELALRNSDLQEFAAIASHDLQEPLRMVSSFSEVLSQEQSDRLDDDGKRHLAFILDGSRRMQRMVQDLLRYSRIGSSAQDSLEVELDQVADEVLGNLQFVIRERDAHVDVGPLPAVVGDRSQLVQLLQNLIHNAIDHHPGAAKVRVWADRHEPWVELHVADDGPGVPVAQREVVFAAFQRGAPAGPDERRGTGIGLAICRRIAERHGGAIWLADGGDGRGTDVVTRLPLPGTVPPHEDENPGLGVRETRTP